MQYILCLFQNANLDCFIDTCLDCPSSTHCLNIRFWAFRDTGFPTLTVAKIWSADLKFRNLTNLFNSPKLECSLYGTDNWKTLTATFLIFKEDKSSGLLFLLSKVQPVGITPNISEKWLEYLLKCSWSASFLLTLNISTTCILACCPFGTHLDLMTGLLRQSKILFFSVEAQREALMASESAVKILSLPIV